ncbi:Spi family protease inhibitor, partial [Persicitalea jodogahamensis]|uniref:Spi family protease inhibitor n=1 Tax=Persicitalea jodogahamensis TaxID=402147 RepID=UPI0016793416
RQQAREAARFHIKTVRKQDTLPNARVGGVLEVTDEVPVLDSITQEPLLYIINGKKGFVVVSADMRTMPVLAYSETNNFRTEDMPPGVKMWLEDAKQKVKDVKRPDKTAHDIVVKEWQKYLDGKLNIPKDKGGRTASCYEWYQYGQFMCQNSTTTYGPLTNTSWGQRDLATLFLPSFGNCSCGKSLAGCGPVAMAQLIEYHHPDPSRPRTTRPRGFPTCNAVDQGEISLGQLMSLCGTASNASYNFFLTCNTFTYPSQVQNGLTTLGFSNGGNSTNFIYSSLKIEIGNGYPVILWGSSCTTCFGDYHIWIADGIDEHRYSSFNCSTLQCDEWIYTYVRMNWGWQGDYNGWYGVSSFNPAGTEYMNSNLRMITGIRP